MATEITTLENYENINKIDFGEKVIFFKFGGEWCVPCKELEKNMECIPDILLYNISVDNPDFEEFLEINEINSIPYTQIKYCKKQITFFGSKTVEELTEIINTIKS